MIISKKLKQSYNNLFEKPELWVSNTLQSVIEYANLRKYHPESPVDSDFSREYKKFWNRYGHFSPKWGWYYASRNDNYDIRYIPNSLYYTTIDQYFNNRKLGWGFNDKNYYSKIFNDIKQPSVVVRKINNVILDDKYKIISLSDAYKRICQFEELIYKPSQESGSGRGIKFLRCTQTEEIIDFLQNPEYDNYIVQEIVRQHKNLSAVHVSSLNCIRVCSLIWKGEIIILSCVLRMGFGNSKVDNATAVENSIFDGMSCGICEDGRLKKYAYSYNFGRKSDRHPDGLIFNNYKIISFDKVKDLVIRCHQRIPNFRLVSWDIAIDELGDPVLIEANMRKGSINFHQFNNGPLFGNLTEEVLNDVFGKCHP